MKFDWLDFALTCVLTGTVVLTGYVLWVISAATNAAVFH